MNTTLKVICATLAGIAIGAVGIESIRAQTKPPGYVVVEFEVTDPAGWKNYADAARALPNTGGTFIVRGAKGTGLAGEQPKSITIVKYPNIDDALAFDASPAYAALKANRDKSSNWRSYAVEGLPN
jgi:uncharacterized protein (DUF1330 family)